VSKFYNDWEYFDQSKETMLCELLFTIIKIIKRLGNLLI